MEFLKKTAPGLLLCLILSGCFPINLFCMFLLFLFFTKKLL